MTTPQDKPPTRPMWKDEHITPWLTTSRAIGLFVTSVILAVVVIVGCGVFVLHEVNTIQHERRVNRAAFLREQAAADADRAELHREIDEFVCKILDHYAPPKPNDPLAPLRAEHNCNIRD